MFSETSYYRSAVSKLLGHYFLSENIRKASETIGDHYQTDIFHYTLNITYYLRSTMPSHLKTRTEETKLLGFTQILVTKQIGNIQERLFFVTLLLYGIEVLEFPKVFVKTVNQSKEGFS